MRNPTRRNRNIGTEKQGHGQDNKLEIPSTRHDTKIYWERLTDYKEISREIHGVFFTFLVEPTRENSFHPCTIDDLCHLIKQIPPSDVSGLNLIILRQPKRKEELLKPVWGRLNYYVEIGSHKGPAIMLESYNMEKTIKWVKTLSIEDRKEFERLVEDGHYIIENKRGFVLKPTIESLRNTMLYRTFLHEVGHYVEYLEKVNLPSQKNPERDYSDYWDDYDKIPSVEKEKFAHNYAHELVKNLKNSQVVPFQRKLTVESLTKDGLKQSDFLP
ncbi:MAG: hypothetical protein AAGA80_26475 [Cyanobacteria bacterium P01_F01_bin.143]